MDQGQLIHFFTAVGIYFWNGKLTAMLITTQAPVGDVKRRDLRQNNASSAARLVGAPGYDAKKANRAVDVRP